MRLSKDKKQQRYQLVIYDKEHGVYPSSRFFATTPKTVRKWLMRFIEGGYQALADLSRRPLYSPRAVPEDDARHIVKLKSKYKRLGADQVKALEDLATSSKTIRKIWRENGVSSRKRRKKHITKQNLREIKKQFALFERVCEDTKDLDDIPEYYPQMMAKNLPKVQYTFREISCGVQFLGFSVERSLTNSMLFAGYINEHLRKYDLIVENGIRQTDNGSEYIGSWSAKEPSAYTLKIESEKLVHGTIPPGAHRFQSDVETVHNLIEVDFYEIERFADRRDFMEKAYTYQLFFNLERPNTYKENKSPWQLAKEKRPDLPKEALMLPPVDLDELLDKKIANPAIGGYDVSSAPWLNFSIPRSSPLKRCAICKMCCIEWFA
ncbi:MAG: helix-turn-helix domain-containing protein [Candidatus Omnitrophota bacterium]|nr:helix-turn-helix domain-containing protein [Candidatus Omnitrophota bacterium]